MSTFSELRILSSLSSGRWTGEPAGTANGDPPLAEPPASTTAEEEVDLRSEDILKFNSALKADFNNLLRDCCGCY